MRGLFNAEYAGGSIVFENLLLSTRGSKKSDESKLLFNKLKLIRIYTIRYCESISLSLANFFASSFYLVGSLFITSANVNYASPSVLVLVTCLSGECNTYSAVGVELQNF